MTRCLPILTSLTGRTLALGLVALQLPLAAQELRGAAPPWKLPHAYAGRAQRTAGPEAPPPAVERAVLDGLRWFARHQNEDGSWSAARLQDRCGCGDACYRPKKPYSADYDPGVTGLALLCFLGAGFGPESKQDLVDTALGQRHTTGDIVRRGLEWLCKAQNEDGSYGRVYFLYGEAIATAALCEAAGLSGNGEWRVPARRGLKFLKLAQRPNPSGNGLWGWRYHPRALVERGRGVEQLDAEAKKALYDSDLSCTGWAVMALCAGRAAGIEPKDYGHLSGALAFNRFVTQLGGDGRPTGLVGYLDPKLAGAKVVGPHDDYVYHPAVMSALGLCMRSFAERDPADPFLRVAADQLLKDLPQVDKAQLSIDYYYWYYASLALHQFDGPGSPTRTGKHWKPWNKALTDALLALQDEKERCCTNGAWLQPDRWSFEAGPLYSTALAVLTLQTTWRYANAFDPRNAEPPKDDLPRLNSKDVAAFQQSRERMREALKGIDADLGAAVEDAIDLYLETARAHDARTDLDAIHPLDEYRPEEVLRVVTRRIETAGTPVDSEALRRRVLEPAKGRPASGWLAEQFVRDTSRSNAAGLGPDERVRQVASATTANALALAKLGALRGLQAQVCADTAAWPALVEDLAREEQRAAEATREIDREVLTQAKGRISKATKAADIALKRVYSVKEDQFWKAVREFHAALVELDAAGRALAELRGLGWSAPPTAIAPASVPDGGPPLSDAVLQLGPHRCVERARLAQHLAADPHLALVPIAHGRVALLDPRESKADGWVFAVEWLGDPYWRIAPKVR